MRLYHYLEAKWALNDIRRRRLKISTITDMNDPYEFESVYSPDLLTQLALDRTKKDSSGNYGAICFSLCWNNVLLWSHYADKHKGICMGFEVSDEIARKIQYVSKPVAIGRLAVASQKEFALDRGEAAVLLLLGGKYDGWAYEEEVRVHSTRHEKDLGTGHYFGDFNDQLALREVIVGARCLLSRLEIEETLVSSGYATVRLAKVRASAVKFEMVFDESGF